MKTIRKLVLIGLAPIGLLLLVGQALAGPGGCRGGGHGMMFPMLLHTVNPTAEQEAKVTEVMRRHRANLQPLFQQLHTAHSDLAARLLAPGTVTAADVAPAVQHLAEVRQQLMQDWVQAALETRAVFTSEQLAKAADVAKRLDALRAEMEKLIGSPALMPPEDPGE